MRKFFTLIIFGLVFSQLSAQQFLIAGQETSPANSSTINTQESGVKGNNPGATDNLSEAVQLHIYPNPASDQLQLIVSDRLIGNTIRIYNLLGSEVSSHPITGSQESIEVSALEQGLYLYHITDKNHRTLFSGKFNKR